MPNPLTGYSPGDVSGKGGRARETNVMSQVDAAEKGSINADTAPTSQGGPSQGAKVHPAASSYAPGPAVASHVYGSPIEGNSASQ